MALLSCKTQYPDLFRSVCRALSATRLKNDELISRGESWMSEINNLQTDRDFDRYGLSLFPFHDYILHSHHVRRSRGCSRTSQNMNKDGLLRERLTRRRVRSPGTCCCTTINRALHFWHFIPQLDHASFDFTRAGIWNRVEIFSQIKLIRV